MPQRNNLGVNSFKFKVNIANKPTCWRCIYSRNLVLVQHCTFGPWIEILRMYPVVGIRNPEFVFFFSTHGMNWLQDHARPSFFSFNLVPILPQKNGHIQEVTLERPLWHCFSMCPQCNCLHLTEKALFRECVEDVEIKPSFRQLEGHMV